MISNMIWSVGKATAGTRLIVSMRNYVYNFKITMVSLVFFGLAINGPGSRSYLTRPRQGGTAMS